MTQEELKFRWSYFLIIDSEFKKTDRYVEHAVFNGHDNSNTFSFEFSKLLLLVCAEFETMCKFINKHIDNSFDFEEKTNIIDLSKPIITKYPKIRDIEIITLSGAVIKPLENWCTGEQSNVQLNLNWWTPHNNIKHNGHESFHEANLNNVTYAISSLYALFIYMSYELKGDNTPYPIISLDQSKSVFCRYIPQKLSVAPNQLPPGFEYDD